MNISLFLPHLDVAGGLGVHCRMVASALNALESPHTYTILAPENPGTLFPHVAAEPFGTETSRATIRRIDVPAGFNLANELDPLLAVHLEELKPDVLYCSYYTGMKSPPCPQIVAFHDAGFLENPEGFGATAAIRKRTLDVIRKSISLIQCISFDARERICRLLPWEERQTVVVWHALPDSAEAISGAISSDPLPAFQKPYFLLPVGAATGFNRKRKNVPMAVTAFRQINDSACRLIIAGTAALTPAVLNDLLPGSESGRLAGETWVSDDDRITILPTIERPTFLRLMKHAIAVVYPSRYEGFGLPTIEAMAVGTPLIAANATSIPEIVGDAGILLNADDVSGFCVAMRELLTNHKTSNHLIEKGNQRIGAYSSMRLGKEMQSMFERIYVKIV